MGSDLTPPPMSEEHRARLLLELNSLTADGPSEMFSLIVAKVSASRDEQWLQQLEPLTQGRHGTVMVDGAIVCCDEHDREPCPQQPERRCASCPGNVTLYLLKDTP